MVGRQVLDLVIVVRFYGGEPNLGEIVKQVIVMRKDLNMRKGKMCAQAAHASMAAIFQNAKISDVNMTIDFNERLKTWFADKFTKIVVSVNSEEELLEIRQKANDAGLNVALITDAGLTEFDGIPTKTCLCIGPDIPEEIDKITGHLKLL